MKITVTTVIFIHTKKKFNHCHVNVIHIRITAFCINFSTIACCPYLTCSYICNYSHTFLCFSHYTV